MRLGRDPLQVLACVATATSCLVVAQPASAYVALMAGQRAKPLNGSFNSVPVLHSNQPEIVTGPGILVNTAPGSAIAAETRRPLRNADYTFNGNFGVHMHHKYYPSDSKKLGGGQEARPSDPWPDCDQSRRSTGHADVLHGFGQKQF